MSLSVVWLPAAVAEVQEARDWYGAISPALGTQFVEAVGDCVRVIAAMPQNFAVLEKGRRRAGVPRFPYGLFFLLEEERVVVIACFAASALRSIGNVGSLERGLSLDLAWRVSAGR